MKRQLPMMLPMEGVRDTTHLVARSAAMRELLRQVALVRDSAVAVLLTGESGVGKEMVAREIHGSGARRNEPLVQVDCSAVPAPVLEKMLFGSDEPGKAEAARAGTIFLAEVDRLSLELQERLLQMLERGTIERGSRGTVAPVKARLIVATTQSLRSLVECRQFREDLFYRLNLFPIDIPPLRHRKEDVAVLAHLFLERYRGERTPSVRGVEQRALKALEDHTWPGNIQELEDVMLKAIRKSGSDGVVHVECLPQSIQDRAPEAIEEPEPTVAYTMPGEKDVIVPLKELERRAIAHALRVTGGNVTRAARALGIGRATMYRKLDRFKILTS